jgi:hypothetical protein
MEPRRETVKQLPVSTRFGMRFRRLSEFFRLLVHDAKEVSVQAILIAHEQRRKRGESAASKLGNFALQAHAPIPRHEQVAYRVRTTNEARKKTHPLNSEEIATQVCGKKRIRKFPA